MRQVILVTLVALAAACHPSRVGGLVSVVAELAGGGEEVRGSEAGPECMGDGSASAAIAWVALPAGEFRMGRGGGASAEAPVHGVKLAAFEMARSETTQRQYQACLGQGCCQRPACDWQPAEGADHPVTCLAWSQAAAFCAWAGGRLPSEAEWEYAARSGGRDRAFPWGDAVATRFRAVLRDDRSADGFTESLAVCSLAAGNSDQGLCDLAGNVAEWVEDDWHDDYGGAPAWGEAWREQARDPARVVRGGSWADDEPERFRSTSRKRMAASAAFANYGFRCARGDPP